MRRIKQRRAAKGCQGVSERAALVVFHTADASDFVTRDFSVEVIVAARLDIR
jgi:hypothetical protein